MYTNDSAHGVCFKDWQTLCIKTHKACVNIATRTETTRINDSCEILDKEVLKSDFYFYYLDSIQQIR